MRESEIGYGCACGHWRGRGYEVFDHLLVLVHLVYVLPIFIHHHTIFSGSAAASCTRVAPVCHAHVSHLAETKTGRSGSCYRRVAQLHVICVLATILCKHILRNLLREECLSELSLSDKTRASVQ